MVALRDLQPGAAGLAGDQRHQDAERTCSRRFGLWFGDDFALFDNISETLTYDDGIFVRWLGNTLLYVVVGAGGATLLATARRLRPGEVHFPGRRAVFAVVLGAVAVPGTALAVPTFLMFSQLGLTNTAVGGHHPVADQPVRPLPDVGLRGRRRADRAAGGRPDRRRGRAPHLLHRSPCRCSPPASSRCCCSRWSRPGTTTSCR